MAELAQQLAMIGSAMAVLDDSVKYPRDAVPADVREAYRMCVAVEEEVSGAALPPRIHLEWLDELTHHCALRVLPKEDLPALRAELDWTGAIAPSRDGVTSLRLFDPARHVCVATDVTPLYWLDGAHLGSDATLIAPSRKAALLWWGSDA